MADDPKIELSPTKDAPNSGGTITLKDLPVKDGNKSGTYKKVTIKREPANPTAKTKEKITITTEPATGLPKIDEPATVAVNTNPDKSGKASWDIHEWDFKEGKGYIKVLCPPKENKTKPYILIKTSANDDVKIELKDHTVQDDMIKKLKAILGE